MAIARFPSIVIDCPDPRELATFYGALLDWKVEASDDWELVAPRTLSLLTIAHRSGDTATRAAMDHVNASGHAFITHTVVNGRFAIRVAIGAEATKEHHVRALWEALAATG